MSVSIRPNHTRIGVPQWRHHPASTVFEQPIPDMTGLTVSDGTEYDLVLPDSVWLTVMEDLQEHFARKAASATWPGSDPRVTLAVKADES